MITRQFLTGQASTGDGGLPGEVEAAATGAGGTRNALLAGAGAALLIGKALQGGSEGEQAQPGDPVSAGGLANDAQAYAGAAGGTGTAQGIESEVVLQAEEVVSGMSLGSAQPAASTDALDDPGVAGEAGAAPSQDELIAETVGGDAAFLVASEPQPEETTGAPELHDGSQDEAETPGDVERR